MQAGTPIAWQPEEIKAGKIDGFRKTVKRPQTSPGRMSPLTPGWCKLDWVVADTAHRKHLSNASNMLDVTWEAPDGTITPLDGYLDPYFQEVYLEADSIPFSPS